MKFITSKRDSTYRNEIKFIQMKFIKVKKIEYRYLFDNGDLRRFLGVAILAAANFDTPSGR